MKARRRYTHFLGHLTTGDAPTWASNLTRGTHSITRQEAAASLRDARKKGIRLKAQAPFNVGP